MKCLPILRKISYNREEHANIWEPHTPKIHPIFLATQLAKEIEWILRTSGEYLQIHIRHLSQFAFKYSCKDRVDAVEDYMRELLFILCNTDGRNNS